MNKVINLYKPIGWTPLELIRKLKEEYPEYKDKTLGYAGRLDPMAEGVLIVLIDEENKKRKKYELLPKTYTFEILFGISTDTYDLMGLITHIEQTVQQQFQSAQLETLLMKYTGMWKQPYPPFSSPRINGKPLFYWARNNLISTITIPEKTVTVYTLTIDSISTLHAEHLLNKINTSIPHVSGDFRQEEIVTRWSTLLGNSKQIFPVMTCSIECSSGVYVRSIAHSIGKDLGTGALALSIKRTAIGNYSIDSSLHLMGTW